ncbi:ribosome biogenesis GTPase Der [Candidatus Marinamargulisbacteria bacterium SCGC AG-343-D04]|nr:ribosome biogenesis GTPase Der [Candidatus Marinamargulisbacteria bacterium SCGC AG-343-D04]
MDMPRVLIIGRPNVGKSTFVNTLLKKRSAITFDEPGVTRDFNEFVMTHAEKTFLVVDSGGILGDDNDLFEFQSIVEEKVRDIVEDMSIIIFMVDAKEGLLPADKTIASLLRKNSPEKVLVVANKADNEVLKQCSHAFSSLGFSDVIPVSSLHRRGIDLVLDHVTESFTYSEKQSERVKNRVKVGIIGRPNVGKSSLINALMNTERVIVSDVSGTTRDSVHMFYQHGKITYEFIDTAGIRKQSKVKGDIEFYSVVRTRQTVVDADVIIVVIDAERGFSNQDKKVVSMILDEGKSMLLFVNKFDVLEDTKAIRKDFSRILTNGQSVLENYPIIFGSALEKTGLSSLLNQVADLMKDSFERIPTKMLNDFNRDVIQRYPAPSKFGKQVKIYYITQVEEMPPTFICFVNNKKYVSNDYQRFLEKRMRAYLGGFFGHTLRIFFKSHRKESES